MSSLRMGALFAVFVLLPGAAPAAGGSSGGGGLSGYGTSPPRVKTPEEIAESRYNSGLKRRDKAWKYEAKAAQISSGKKRDKLMGKAQKQYGKAIKNFRGAIEKNPVHYQAHSSLGYALRRTGQYEDALEAYDRALGLAPSYAEAIEYRAEAYLGLDRLEDAKGAYIRLFALERTRADELMRAMETWIEQKQGDPSGLAPETLQEFSTWVQERREIARQTAGLSDGESSRW